MESRQPRSRASCDVQAFEILFFAPAVARRKSMRFSELPHLAPLMRADFQVRARFPGARQNESGFSVFGEIGERVGLVHFPWAFQLCGAGQAVPLMTQCRQGDTRGESRVPDVLFLFHLD